METNLLDWHTLGMGTKLIIYPAHYIGLLFMITIYTFKVRWLLSKPAPAESTPARGDKEQAIRYAYLTLLMPWEIESQDRALYRYIEFILFHLAITVAIGWTGLLPLYQNSLMSVEVILFCQIFFCFGFVIALSRLARRLFVAAHRLISSPDDYFCLTLLAAWFFCGFQAAPMQSEGWLFSFFGLAAFFLFYVPFSKISHYLYYPFIRYHMGKHFGHRGTWPKQHSRNN